MKLRILTASAILAAAFALPAEAALAATPTTQAAAALQYLAGQQQNDGSIGPDTLGETADYALGAKFQGLDPKQLIKAGNSVYTYLSAWVASSAPCSPVPSARDGNSIGKVVQAVAAGGLSATNFGGRNLLSDLEGVGGATGGAYDAATGTFADCSSFDPVSGKHNNAVYAQANAILGLDAANNPLYPVPVAALQHLRALQDPNGGWPVFGQDSSNSTAMAVMALSRTFTTACDPTLTLALTFLRTQQDPASGGLLYSTYPPFPSSASDPLSDAVGIQALVAVGQNPAGPAWTNSKGNPASDLLTFQDSQSGGLSFDHASAADVLSTSQAPAGLDRAPLPDGNAHFAAGTCAASTSASPSPSPSVRAPTLPHAGAPTPGPPAWLGLTALTALPVVPAAAVRVVRRRRRIPA